MKPANEISTLSIREITLSEEGRNSVPNNMAVTATSKARQMPKLKKPAFPEIHRVGHTRATIYETPSHGCVSFTVAWYEGRTRKRKAFADLDAARLHAQAKVNSLSRGEAQVLHLSGAQRLEYLRAREAVQEFGLALDTVAIEYRDAKRLVRGTSLIEVGRDYTTRHGHDAPRKSVEVVVEELLEAKRDEGCSPRYLQDLTSRLGQFKRAFHCDVGNLNGALIRTWLQGLKVANRSRNNSRRAVQTLVEFAKGRKYLPRDWAELEAVPKWKTEEEEIEVFTPAEIRLLLKHAPKNLVPFLALGGFAGLRSAEISRLDWSRVDFKAGLIRVDGKIAKTNSRRLVPMTANLRLWLKPHARKEGLVISLANLPNAIRRLVNTINAGREKGAACRWKHNALRHSYISYRVAETQNVAKVSLEAGNSPQMIFKHYRELVTPESAKAWFGIAPTRR